MNSRRIVFINHTAKMGGGEIALLSLVTHLDRSRFTPVVVLFSDGPLRQKLIGADIETHLLSLPASVIDARKDALGASTLFRMRDILSTIRLVMRLRRFLLQHNAELIHTNSLKSDIIGGMAGRLAGLPVIWHVRDRIAADYLPPVVTRVFRFLARHIPTFVIANSGATLSTLKLTSPRRQVVHSGLAHVVHDGVTDDWVDSFSVANAQAVIGLVGRITRWKGQHIFIQMAAQVVRRFPKARFQIVGSALFGEDAYEREIRQLVESLGLTEVVEFAGYREDIDRVIAGLDILVHASTTGEPFGQVIVEGMAAGKPVVATAGGGVPEIVIDGITGLLVPMDDVEAMAAAVQSMLENPARAAEMGRAGRQRVIDHFTIEHTARKVEAIYEALLNPAADPARIEPALAP